jgi:hypothetical protein
MNHLRALSSFLAPSLALVAALAATLGAPSIAAAEEPALVNAEAHIAHGIAQSGGGGTATWRESTYLVGGTVDVAIMDEPWVSFFGTVEFEGFDRAGLGGFAGLRLRPQRGAMRLSAGLGGMLVPYTALGATLSGGACRRKSPRICGDLEGVFYFGGSDIPDGRVASQFLFKLGWAFDVL